MTKYFLLIMISSFLVIESFAYAMEEKTFDSNEDSKSFGRASASPSNFSSSNNAAASELKGDPPLIYDPKRDMYYFRIRETPLYQEKGAVQSQGKIFSYGKSRPNQKTRKRWQKKQIGNDSQSHEEKLISSKLGGKPLNKDTNIYKALHESCESTVMQPNIISYSGEKEYNGSVTCKSGWVSTCGNVIPYDGKVFYEGSVQNTIEYKKHECLCKEATELYEMLRKEKTKYEALKKEHENLIYKMTRKQYPTPEEKPSFIIKSFKPTEEPKLPSHSEASTFPKESPSFDAKTGVYYYGKKPSEISHPQSGILPAVETDELIIYSLVNTNIHLPLSSSEHSTSSENFLKKEKNWQTEEGWERIERSRKYPWRVHGRLIMSYERESKYAGSGTLIGDKYVLTAAHNFLSAQMLGVTPTKITFYIGVNGSEVGWESEGEQIAIHPRWYETFLAEYDEGADIALIKLKAPLGQKVGFLGIRVIDEKYLENTQVEVTGYSGIENGRYLYTIKSDIEKIEKGRLFYKANTCVGQSGGAIWKNDPEGPFCIAVHGYGKDSLEDSRGAFIDQGKATMIKRWIEYFSNDLPTPNTPEKQSPENLFDRGWMYANKDSEKVAKALPMVSCLPQNEADKRAMILFRQAAALGSAHAENWIGEMYQHGRVFTDGKFIQDYAEACRWYRKAAEKGLSQAQDNLAVMYQYGTGIPHDKSQALFWLYKVIDNKHSTLEQKEKAQRRILMLNKDKH